MNSWPHLNNAPIVEGLMDIQFEQSSEFLISSIEAIADDLADEFPSREEIRIFRSQFSVSAEGERSFSSETPAPAGYILRSADGKWVAQFRLDGFSLSRLEPYLSWQELKDKAEVLWRKYRANTNLGKVNRFALRYINRIVLPPNESFETTFNTTFSIAETLPQAVAGFLLRFVIPFEAESAIAIVTQALPENSQECTFDLDTFSLVADGISDENMWMGFEVLHSIKNRLFFESLTPVSLENYK